MKNWSPKKRMLALAMVFVLVAALLLAAYMAKNKEEPTGGISASSIVSSVLEPASVTSGLSMASSSEASELLPDESSIGILQIERINLACRVYGSTEATIMEDMKHGAAHYESTSLWEGNIGLCAHNGNASYSYFSRLGELAQGDIITYETEFGVRQYSVVTIVEIADTDWSYLGATEDNRITLTTCVAGKPEMRLCVQAVEI